MARAGRMDQDTRAVAMLKRLERSFRIRVDRRDRRRGPRLRIASGKALDLPNAHATASDAAREFQALLRIRNSQQSPAMPRRKAALLDQVLDHGLELQKANGVRDRRAVFSGPLGDVLLREIELVGEALKGASLFHGI